MRSTNLQRAHKYGVRYAEDQIKILRRNPDYIGVGLIRENFPEFIARMAEVSVFMIFPYKCKNINVLEVEAYDAAYYRTIELLKENKLWILPPKLSM